MYKKLQYSDQFFFELGHEVAGEVLTCCCMYGVMSTVFTARLSVCSWCTYTVAAGYSSLELRGYGVVTECTNHNIDTVS